ncbi:hypothetical protein EWM62_07275 [Mucilaginibacter terrigena]|uniref:Sigma-70 family RNA polymerase sigma factor n=1 Tax=Mucilaginibacter terrigena TaxID=2492395 RepID=A0A4Q5LL52_9SPHI|nr:hypothetical protein [Mucilaginibacter terrigena]RYU90451.1 hypothetical protein EWM62_07275 [Mucilaginibacter terrigena]
MKPQLTSAEASLPAIKQTLRGLYNSYGGMLLGYIQEVIKDRATAEQYLAELFTDLRPAELNEILAPGTNVFCRLQLLARKKLAAYINSVGDCADKHGASPPKNIGGNKFIDMMSHEQQLVFCGVHYHGKSITALAAELNQPEAAIRQLLKESFTIIRNNRDDTGVH